MAARAYGGNSDLKNFMLSPIYGTLEGLAEISLFIGTHDNFIADSRKFKKILEEKGIHINYFEHQKIIHVWMLLDMPEANAAAII